jgi:hypothetical protein
MSSHLNYGTLGGPAMVLWLHWNPARGGLFRPLSAPRATGSFPGARATTRLAQGGESWIFAAAG